MEQAMERTTTCAMVRKIWRSRRKKSKWTTICSRTEQGRKMKM